MTRRIIKWSLIGVVSIILLLVAFGFWFINLLPEPKMTKEELQKVTPTELTYLTENQVTPRGKILAVVTSSASMGQTDKSTGYELTELARAYYVFEANGFEVDVASPQGGEPPMVIDDDDMKEFDYAFLNDKAAQEKVKHSIPMSQVDPEQYQAVYFVGGKGAMFDFPDNPHIKSLVRAYYESDKVVAAVCHGPAALVNVTLSNGQPLLADKTISSFTNEEELFLIPDAREIFPFLLQEKLTEQGASFNKGIMYLNTVSSDDGIITGQNPWSTWKTAEAVVEQLGYTPKTRIVTPEEHTVTILAVYEQMGFGEAKQHLRQHQENIEAIDFELLAVHSIVAVMQWRVFKAIDLIRLLSHANSLL